MGDRSIEASERSGVLHPLNLSRYSARWFEPSSAVSDAVAQYWSVEWNLGDEVVEQSIVASPAVTLSIESGSVPAPLVITGIHRRAWVREITGSGVVLGIRLRPAGLAVLSDLTPDTIADATLAVSEAVDERLHLLMAQIAEADTTVERVARADTLIGALLAETRMRALHRLANDVVTEIETRGQPIPVSALAQRFSTSERTIQRALKQTLGQGPAWVGRWIRLQEVVRRLSVQDAPSLSEVAVDIGYADQAHLVNDFRSAVGTTPGAYVRSLRGLSG